MSANLVAGFHRLCCKLAFLFLSIAVGFGSDSATNSSGNKLLFKVDLAGEPAKEYALLKIGDAQGGLKLDSPTNSSPGKTDALLLTVSKVGGRCGVSFAQNIGVNSNQWYDLTFRARTDKRENDRGYGLTVSLENRDNGQVCARTTLPEVGGEWRDYTVALHSRLTHAAALTITMSEPGAIWFDEIKLQQRQTGREMRTP